MTNKEIKLELAKAALCNSDLTAVKEFYEWVIADEESESEIQENTERPISTLIDAIALHHERYATTLTKVFEWNNIDSVEKLLAIGKRNFRKYRHVGGGSICWINEALENLYGITEW